MRNPNPNPTDLDDVKLKQARNHPAAMTDQARQVIEDGRAKRAKYLLKQGKSWTWQKNIQTLTLPETITLLTQTRLRLNNYELSMERRDELNVKLVALREQAKKLGHNSCVLCMNAHMLEGHADRHILFY